MTDWPTNSASHAHMKMRQSQNRARNVRAEDWMRVFLAKTDETWTHQAQWGYRLFDFWSRRLGIAIEVDGDSHNAEDDRASDAKMFKRSAIRVIRVRNFNTNDALMAIAAVKRAPSWNERRLELGKKPISGSD